MQVITNITKFRKGGIKNLTELKVMLVHWNNNMHEEEQLHNTLGDCTPTTGARDVE